MANIQQSIDILTIHKARLLETKTFEEYRDAHVAYIEMLIEQYQADLAKQESKEAFMRWEAIVTTTTSGATSNVDVAAQEAPE